MSKGEDPNLETLEILAVREGLAIQVVVAPGCSHPGLKGLHGEGLKMAVRAAPEKGKANKELVELVASLLGISRQRVAILSGHGSRKKMIAVSGISKRELLEKLKQEFS